MRRLLLALSIVSLWMLPSAGVAEERYSGQILSIDHAGGTLVLEEMTAAPSEAPVAIRRTIVVAPGVSVQLLRRSNEPMRVAWPGGFSASPLALGDLQPGDYVTVVGEERQGRIVATGLHVSRDDSSPSASP